MSQFLGSKFAAVILFLISLSFASGGFLYYKNFGGASKNENLVIKNLPLTDNIIDDNLQFSAREEKKGIYPIVKKELEAKEVNSVPSSTISYAAAPPKELSIEEVNMFQVAKNESELKYWLEVAGSERVMLKLLEDAGGGAQIDCHQEAHTIGRLAFQLYGASVFEKGDSSCHSGFYHGAMEAFLFENGTINLADNITKLCDIFDTSFGRFECLHGVGHGILAYVDYDLPEALVTCRKLKTNYDASSCYGGLFMENIVTGQGLGAGEAHETEWVSQDPHFPCNGIEKDYNVQFECYQMQTSWMLTLKKYDFSLVAKECLNASPNMVSVCYKSYGRDAAGHTLRNNQKIVELCQSVPKEYYDQCIIGGLNVIVDFWGEKLDKQASELCKLIPEINKNICYSTLAERLGGIFKEEAKKSEICNSFEQEYRYLCEV